MRIDVALTKRGLAASREKAQSLIAAGLVLLNGKICKKPSVKINEADELIVCGSDIPYVSRGGLKLEKALKVFDINVSGLTAIDIGASTGGFTDVLLQNGAKKVYAIDVGFGQLDPKIASDSRVISMEHTNARALTAEMFEDHPEIGVMDVSFISIQLILPAAFEVLGDTGRMISLVKPQFEAGRANIGKGGIVGKKSVHEDVLNALISFVPAYGWSVRAIDYSPIAGGDGNIEFLADIVPAARCATSVTPQDVERLVKEAHAAMKKS
ncbi:MAG: TlyA family RNA methyltransferase [Clostridia bacterium]|nr:TlyA family RNA methyltransferase [Clostridia bacterium]